MYLIGTAMLLARSLSVGMDPAVWMSAAGIDWPGDDRQVLVLQPASGRYEIDCGGSTTPVEIEDGENYSFRMGEHCGRLVVLMNLSPGVSGAPVAERFLAHHEAFHLAAQIYGSGVPWEFLGVDPDAVHRFSGGSQFRTLFEQAGAVTDGLRDGKRPSCEPLLQAYSALSVEERKYIDYKMFWEWPAEFYAEQIVFGERLNDYEKFREGLFRTGNEGYELFTAGVKVGLALDTLVGRQAWQESVAGGASMFDVLLENTGCQSPLRGPAMRMRRVALLP